MDKIQKNKYLKYTNCTHAWQTQRSVAKASRTKLPKTQTKFRAVHVTDRPKYHSKDLKTELTLESPPTKGEIQLVVWTEAN